MLIPIKLSPVWAKKEFGTLSLKFPAFKASPHPAAVTNIYRHTLSSVPWQAEKKQSCSAVHLLGIKMCILGLFFPSQHIRSTICIPQFGDDRLFKQSSQSWYLLWWHPVYKSRLAAGTDWKCGRKEIFQIDFSSTFYFLNIIALEIWGLSPKMNGSFNTTLVKGLQNPKVWNLSNQTFIFFFFSIWAMFKISSLIMKITIFVSSIHELLPLITNYSLGG